MVEVRVEVLVDEIEAAQCAAAAVADPVIVGPAGVSHFRLLSCEPNKSVRFFVYSLVVNLIPNQQFAPQISGGVRFSVNCLLPTQARETLARTICRCDCDTYLRRNH